MYRTTEFPFCKKIWLRSAATCLMLLALVYQTPNAQARGTTKAEGPMTIFEGSANGIFTSPSGGTVTGVGTNYFTWGQGSPSSLKFTGRDFDVRVPTGFVFGPKETGRKNPFFSIGTLNYNNGVTVGGTGANNVRLDVSVKTTFPVAAGPTVIPAQLDLVNTPNNGDPAGDADYVYLPKSLPPVKLMTVGGFPIAIEPSGFGKPSPGGFAQIDKFFVYEGASAQADLYAKVVAPAEPIVDGQVKSHTAFNFDLPGSPLSIMQAEFTPNYNLTLDEAAELSGYDHFNWYQVVEESPYPFQTIGGLDLPKKGFFDPPFGGYRYLKKKGGFVNAPADNRFFYWDEGGPPNYYNELKEMSKGNNGKTLEFHDEPQDWRLTGSESIKFSTYLAGVYADGDFDVLYGWFWKSNFDGVNGSVQKLKNTEQSASRYGHGGVTILKENVSARDIPLRIRKLMQRNGARNVPLYLRMSLKAPKSVKAGTKITLRGKVIDESKKAVRGKKIIIMAGAENKTWKKIATKKTGRFGEFLAKVKFLRTTKYRAEFSGDNKFAAAKSKAAKVNVNP